MLSDDDGAFLISTLSREEPEGGEQVGELYTELENCHCFRTNCDGDSNMGGL